MLAIVRVSNIYVLICAKPRSYECWILRQKSVLSRVRMSAEYLRQKQRYAHLLQDVYG